MHTATATKELLAPRQDVWSFVSAAGRLADWWPGIFAAQDHGDRWTIEGEEREGLTRVADQSSGGPEREETVLVDRSGPDHLRLRFERSGYDVQLSLSAASPDRTEATLSIAVSDTHETLAERLEEVVGVASSAVTGPSDSFAEAILERLYELCQTAADS